MYSPVDEIKSRLDVVELIQGYIRLQKAGRNYRACCPFHSEKTPSFMISPERQIWHCFGCGKGGSIFDFVMEMEGVEFGDALRMLARRTGVELSKVDNAQAAGWQTERTRLYEICDLAVRFYQKQLEAGQLGRKVGQYLAKRGLKDSTIKEWKVGYAPGQWRALYDFLTRQGYSDENILKTGLIIQNNSSNAQNRYYDRFRDRIIFPIFDLNGTAVGFTGRENPDSPDSRMGKYINVSNTLIYDKSRILYGLDKAKLAVRSSNACILVEGQIDVLMAHQAGSKNVIASSGTALTEEHLKIIKRYTDNLIMAFDMDQAGETATKRGIDLAIQFGFNVEIASLPQGKDPADCILKDAALWTKSIGGSKKIIEFYIESAFAKNNPQTLDGRKQISAALLPVIKKIPNKIEQAHWLQEISRRIGIQENTLIEEMQKIKLADSYLPSQPAAAAVNQNKSRGMPNIEEYTLGLILSDSENLNQIKNEPSELFTNPDFGEIFNSLKKKKESDLKKLKKNLPVHLANQLDYLVFRTEAYRNLFKEDVPEDEMEFCLEKLKSRYRYNRQCQYNLAIKEAEGRNDQAAVRKLIKEMNNFIKVNNQ